MFDQGDFWDKSPLQSLNILKLPSFYSGISNFQKCTSAIYLKSPLQTYDYQYKSLTENFIIYSVLQYSVHKRNIPTKYMPFFGCVLGKVKVNEKDTWVDFIQTFLLLFSTITAQRNNFYVRISSVNEKKSAGNCRFVHIY